MLWIIAVITFPIIMENPVMLVVIIISKVCRSFSPEIAEAVRTGTTTPRIKICVTASAGYSQTMLLYMFADE